MDDKRKPREKAHIDKCKEELSTALYNAITCYTPDEFVKLPHRDGKTSLGYFHVGKGIMFEILLGDVPKN